MRFAALIAGVCLALAPSASLKAESPLASLLASVRAAGGTPYAFHLRAIESETVDGTREERELQLDGARRFLRRCEGIACRGLYFDGRHAFETNLNDTALPAAAPSPFEGALQVVLLEAFADPNFPMQGGEVALRTPVEHNGISYARLRVRVTPLDTPVDVWIDPQTHLVAAIEDAAQRVSFQYAAEPSVLPALPSELAWDGPNARAQHFSGWTIVDKPLAAPVGLVPVFAAPVAVLKLLPSERGALPVVACTIAGRTVPALLDTGNSSLGMSLELAERLNIEPSGGTFSIRGVGQYVTGIAPGPSFALGPVAFPPAKFALLHELHHYGYELVLGADVFAHLRVSIDYARGEVRLAPANDSPQPSAMTSARAIARTLTGPGSVPLEFANFVPVAQVRLGATAASLALDTGDESTVNLAGDYYARNPALFTPTGSLPVAGIGGASTELVGTIPSISLAGFQVTRQRIGATKGLVSTADGHLGSGFLAHFVTTFDYANARLELVPRGGDTAISVMPSASP